MFTPERVQAPFPFECVRVWIGITEHSGYQRSLKVYEELLALQLA